MFIKGQSGNPAGRPVGAHNHRTIRLIELFDRANFDYAKEFARLLMKMPDDKRYEEMKFLLKYVAPEIMAMSFAPMSQQDSLENATRLMDELKAIENANTPTSTQP